jgi:2-polyprenyl-6-methoxyphenol hydroxylase-like FAD-dependent oxidoreductase
VRSLTPSNARICVAGAGPGGLTCARILQRNGLEVTVYDRDPDPYSRDQGGTLDRRAEDGQFALKEAGLLDEFDALARPEGQEMRQLDTTGALLDRHVPEEGERYKPEIDRGQLRDLLLRSLAPGTVRWGHRLEAVDGPANGARRLRFADGTTVEADLVIGADGAFSRVRPALSDAVPSYTGVTFLEARYDDVERRHPELAELVGPGSAAAADGERGVFGQRNSGDHIRLYIIQRAALDWLAAAGLSADDTAGLHAHLRTAFAGWSPRMVDMITGNDGPYVDRPLFVLPVGHTWEHSPTATLLGDAAHLMPPVGVGVNLAMLDACELALALAGEPTVGEAVRAYEATMFVRSTDMARRAEGVAEHLIAAD